MADVDVLGHGFHRDALAAGAFVRVVNWHNTPAARRGELRAQLAAYLEHYDPLLPEDLDRFVETGRWHRDRPGFVPAFYDSYRNNVTVAAPVCEELGVTAWFYPPTALLEVEPEQQRAFALEHDVTVLDEEPEPPWFMTWDDLARLAERHVVAAHTATHAAGGRSSRRRTSSARSSRPYDASPSSPAVCPRPSLPLRHAARAGHARRRRRDVQRRAVGDDQHLDAEDAD